MSDNRITVLQQVKLVPEDNMMTTVAAYTVLTDIIEEGIRSTFGMRERDAIILRLSHDLLKALEQAAKSDELERKLKGAQLENGRLKKKVESLDSAGETICNELVQVRGACDILREERDYWKAKANEQDNQKSAESGQDAGPVAEGA